MRLLADSSLLPTELKMRGFEKDQPAVAVKVQAFNPREV